ncbi:hypothetical protein ACFRMQ_22775 [Kitasatospora sp. NPDC056783]|uniref:hypothetical protein n=1 Tax=Kitasatospora sp. NPDC056783 TaxID=3345943 RepID=UPI0036C40410
MRPVLLVDVDGPLNPCAAKPHRRPEGYGTHRLMTPRWEAAERRRLREWGLPNKSPKPLRVWLNPAHGPALAALPFDLVWATTWEEEANIFLAPLLRLPTLPFITWSDPQPQPDGGVFWKTPDVVAWAQGRPFAWVDDLITDADRAWVQAHHSGPALLHHIDPKTGLMADDFALLSDWAQRLVT